MFNPNYHTQEEIAAHEAHLEELKQARQAAYDAAIVAAFTLTPEEEAIITAKYHSQTFEYIPEEGGAPRQTRSGKWLLDLD